MKLKQLFTDDSAVSPVIGVILMVAITVILAAVIGSFVLNLGGSLQQNAPQASFSFEYQADGGSNSEAEVTITHNTGDSIDSAQLSNVVQGTNNYTDATEWSGTVSAGSQAVVQKGSTDTSWNGETIRVTWNSENGENSATLSRSTAP